MLVENRIHGKIYRKLIEYASKKCDAVMFVTKQYYEELSYGKDSKELRQLQDTTESFEKMLEKDFLKKRTNSDWAYGRTTHPGTDEEFKQGFGVYTYRFSPNVVDYLLTNQDFYKWRNSEYPEDVSLYVKGYCWLYVIAHEKICVIFCDSEEEYEYLKSIGIKFWETRYTPKSKEDRYYEKYDLKKI